MLGLALLGSSAEVHAQLPSGAAERIELHWDAPVGCPTGNDVKAEVERLLGAGATVPAERVVARARIEALARGNLLVLELSGREKESRRELVGKTCGELGKAAALVLALAIDPGLLERSGSNSSSALRDVLECPPQTSSAAPTGCASECPAAPLAPVCPVQPLPPVAPRPEAAPSPPSGGAGFRWGLGVSVSLGALPQPLPSPELLFGYGGSRARLEVGAQLAFAQIRLSETSFGGAFELWTLFPRGCLTRGLGRAALSACGGVEAGAMHAAGYGTDLVHDRWSSWVTPAFGLSAELPFERSRVGLSAWLQVPLVRTHFDLNGTEVFRANPVVGRLGLVGTFETF